MPRKIGTSKTPVGCASAHAPRPHSTGKLTAAYQAILAPLTARIEPLEPRTLLAVTPIGLEFRVNTHPNGSQSHAEIAQDTTGGFVLTWQSYGQDGPGYEIYAQRYNAAGRPQGGEFRVNTFTDNHQRFPDVAMDADGDFVISWTSYYQDGGIGGIYAQRYSAAGEPRGPEFRVNTYTIGAQHSPTVAMDADGDFVIAWDSKGQADSSWDIFAQRYNAAGEPQGSEFQVNAHTSDDQTTPSLAMDADGNFVVAWQGAGLGDTYGVYARRYNSAGVAQGDDFRVNTYTSGFQRYLSAGMDADGDFVVAWSSADQDGNGYGVYAQRYNALEARQGIEFRVNTYTYDWQWNPAIAMNADGDFIIAWMSAQDGSGGSIQAQRFDADGAPQGPEFLVNTYTTNSQSYPAVILDSEDNYVIAWHSWLQDGDRSGVYAQRYLEVPNPALLTGIVWDDADADGARDAGESGAAGVTVQLADGYDDYVLLATTTDSNGAYHFDVVPPGGPYYLHFTSPSNKLLTEQNQGPDDTLDSDPDPLTGRTALFSLPPGQTDLFYDAGLIPAASISGTAYTDLDRNGTRDAGDPPLSSAMLYIDANNNAQLDPGESSFKTLADGQYTLTNLRPGTHQLRAIAPDFHKSSNPESGLFSVSLSVGQDRAGIDFAAQKILLDIPAGTEFRVNAATDNAQYFPAIAMDADGDFVVAWENNRLIYAQRYNAAGLSLGNEFRVNTSSNPTSNPTLAIDADGDFVIAWQSYGRDGSAYGIYAQRYNSAGVKQGAEFRVNTYTNADQDCPAIAMDAAGNFVIAWESMIQDGSNDGIYAQRYNAAGVKQGVEFRANATTLSSQKFPAIAMDTDGNFIVTWQSYDNYGNRHDIYAQRYNAAAVAQGPEFRVNTYTSSDQFYPAVAMAADGDFVIAWQTRDRAGTGWAVYAQRFAAAGEPNGAEFRVNAMLGASDYHWSAPSHTIAMDAGGNFVVAWQRANPSYADIYAQQYNAAGEPKGGEFRVNSYTTDNQWKPAVAVATNGNFVITWQSNLQDGSDHGVYAQRFLRDNPPNVLTATTLSDTLRLARSANNLTISVDGLSPSPLYTYPLNSSFPITLSTLSGHDTLILDFSSGSPLPSSGLTFTGGDGNDTIVFTTSTNYDSFTPPLDLADNTLLVQNSTLQQVESWLKLNRLTSSSQTQYTTLAPFPQPDGSILVKLTYTGDMNADGVVNALDYFIIDSNFLSQSPSTPLHYSTGDLNLDSTINALDYFLIDSAFLAQSSPLSSSLAVSPIRPLADSPQRRLFSTTSLRKRKGQRTRNKVQRTTDN